MKHNSRASMSHNAEYRNYGGKNLYRLCSPSNPDLVVVRDYLQLFKNRSADFYQVKIVFTKRELTYFFILRRFDGFSSCSLTITRLCGFDVSFTDSFYYLSVDEICRVCYSRLLACLINDWLLDSIYIYRSGGSDSGAFYSHDFERLSDRS